VERFGSFDAAPDPDASQLIPCPDIDGCRDTKSYNRHVAEHGAERRSVMTFVGQSTSARHSGTAKLAHLERDYRLLGPRKPEPEVRQAGLLIAFAVCNLHLRRQAELQFRSRLNPDKPFSASAHPRPVSQKRTPAGTNLRGLHALKVDEHVTLTLDPKWHAYLIPATDVVEVGGVRIETRDDVAITDLTTVKIVGTEDAEVFLADAA
jgi:hypothetical protein